MSETERAKEFDEAGKAADAKRRADAEETANAGEKLDRVSACLDSLGKRMDPDDAAAVERRKDEECESEVEGEIEKDKPKELAADSKKDSRMIRNADDTEEIAHFKDSIDATHAIAADSVLAEIQSQADRAATAWGKDAKHPWDGEGITAYRRRSARAHQKHSPAWKGVDLVALSGQALRNATAQIFADSIAASTAPESYGETLREVTRRDPETGQIRREFYGSPSAWTNQFKSGRMLVRAFKTGARYD